MSQSDAFNDLSEDIQGKKARFRTFQNGKIVLNIMFAAEFVCLYLIVRWIRLLSFVFRCDAVVSTTQRISGSATFPHLFIEFPIQMH